LRVQFQIARCGVGPIPVAAAANIVEKIRIFTPSRFPTGLSRSRRSRPISRSPLMMRKLVHGDEQAEEPEAGDQSAKDEPASDSEEWVPDADITDQEKTESDPGRSTEG